MSQAMCRAVSAAAKTEVLERIRKRTTCVIADEQQRAFAGDIEQREGRRILGADQGRVIVFRSALEGRFHRPRFYMSGPGQLCTDFMERGAELP